ncbi:MAG: FtsX-like permease family protein [Pseudomonadota bacterium]
MLGVALVAAGGGLFRQVSDGLLTDTRAVFGGDLEIETRTALEPAVLDWMRERAAVSLLIELRTMMLAGEETQLVELQSVDEYYPLYGEVALTPPQTVADAVDARDGQFGVALDPVLARRLNLGVGDEVGIGNLSVEVRALIDRQPDRGLTADWRGPPVLIAAQALPPSGLVQPGSRLEYEYRVKIDGNLNDWRDDLLAAFPTTEFEVETFTDRSRRVSEVLEQVGSGLLLIGFSALFVGGLGVFNSVRAYLDAKLTTVATLRALGLRDARLAAVYLIQVAILAASASFAGALVGAMLAIAGTSMVAERLPLNVVATSLITPLWVAWLFGVLTAMTFALPAIGRALSITPAALFRGIDISSVTTPGRWWGWTALGATVLVALLLAALPQPLFGAAFVATVLVLLGLLEGLVRMIRAVAQRFGDHPVLAGRFPLKLAVANLYRPGSPLRVTLMSLGSALTVLVAATVVTMALQRTIAETISERAPALVFYDISANQVTEFKALVGEANTLQAIELAPLVLGRLSHVNGEALRASADTRQVIEARDEHKLTHRLRNIDGVALDRGQWWPDTYAGPPLVAMEDREADQIGLKVGDRLGFDIMGETVDAKLAAIYSQRRIETRFWFEAVFSDGVLDPFVTRYVGTAYLDDDEAIDTETQLARAMPNVVTVRTARMLGEAQSLLARAAGGLAVLSGISLLASLMVLASVVATSRERQAYDATVLHSLGARLGAIRASLLLEYALIATLVSLFAFILGGTIAFALLNFRLNLGIAGVLWVGAAAAVVLSAAALGLGARHLLKRLRIVPAELLRAGS